MPKFEYISLECSSYSRNDGNGTHPSDNEINQLGEDGWELVCSLEHWGNSNPALFFKREVKE